MFSEDPAITELINITESQSLHKNFSWSANNYKTKQYYSADNHQTRIFSDELTIIETRNITESTITGETFLVKRW